MRTIAGHKDSEELDLLEAQLVLAEAERIIAELVACKELKEHIDGADRDSGEWAQYVDEYERRKPLVWSAARDFNAKRRS